MTKDGKFTKDEKELMLLIMKYHLTEDNLTALKESGCDSVAKTVIFIKMLAKLNYLNA